MKTLTEMAQEAGFETMLRKGRICGFDRDGDYTEELERFAELVRADEREQIIDLVAMYGGPVDLEAAIRARRTHEDRN